MSQLDVATGAFLENDDALWISEARDEVRLTQLFEWYAADFGGSKDSDVNDYSAKLYNHGEGPY